MQDPARPSDEARALLGALPERGIEVQTFTRKRLVRRQLDLAPDVLVAGDLDSVPMALDQLGVTGPFVETYPASLAGRLGRRVWRSTVGAVQRQEEPVFVKPADRAKRFTGFVYGHDSGALHFEGASRHTAVWCAEVVGFRTEFRAYIVEGAVRGVCRYRGEGPEPPRAFLDGLVAQMRTARDPTSGFALDVGLVDEDWVVVECNEGFGLGLYDGLPAGDYADLVVARWRELIGAS